MCNRDGIKVYKLSDVKLERRVGYAWYTYAPEKLFKLYKEWLKKVEAEKAYTVMKYKMICLCFMSS